MRHLSYMALSAALVACASLPSSTTKSTAGAEPYTITSVIEVLKPINLAALHTDAQQGSVIKDNGSTVTLQVTVNPQVDQLTTLIPNPSWYKDYTSDPTLKPYLDAGITTNWDARMRGELLSALKKDGIDPDQMDDVALVKAVSHWLFASNRFSFIDHFISYDVQFVGGKALVIPELMSHFQNERAKNKLSNDADALALGIYGKTMFEQRHSGNCTMSATLQATVLKALGIPTRLVLFVPAVDANVPSQLKMAADAIHEHQIQKTVLSGLSQSQPGSWSSHTYNEVYVGKRWVRLNYDKLGQMPADPFFLGLMIQVQSMADWSDANMGQSWGVHAESHSLASLTSVNPYTAHSLTDNQNALGTNPPVPSALTVAHLTRASNADDMSLPANVRSALSSQSFFLTLDTGSQPADFGDFSVFRAEVSRTFTLTASGHPSLSAQDVGSWQEPGAQGFLIAVDSGQTMDQGVSYNLIPQTTAGSYHWNIDSGVKLIAASGVPAIGVTSTQPISSTSAPTAEITTLKVVNANVATASQMSCQPNSICVILTLEQAYDINTDQVRLMNFIAKAASQFTLSASNQTTIPASVYGLTLDANGRAALALIIEPNDAQVMVKGLPYQIKPLVTTQNGATWAMQAGVAVVK